MMNGLILPMAPSFLIELINIHFPIPHAVEVRHSTRCMYLLSTDPSICFYVCISSDAFLDACGGDIGFFPARFILVYGAQ
jgi:hypothetical protein